MHRTQAGLDQGLRELPQPGGFQLVTVIDAGKKGRSGQRGFISFLGRRFLLKRR